MLLGPPAVERIEKKLIIDSKKLQFSVEPKLDGLAIMSDTDNSKMKSIAYFQNIYFSVD